MSACGSLRAVPGRRGRRVGAWSREDGRRHDACVKEFVDFLGGQPPFDQLDGDDLERISRQVEVEYVVGGSPVAVPPGQWAVVRSGAVELVEGDRVVDLLGPGDTAGAEEPVAGRVLRAAGDSLLYRIPDPRDLVRDPVALDLARRRSPRAGGLAHRAHLAVADLMRPVLHCGPEDAVRDVARRIGTQATSCAVVTFPDGSPDSLGIVTDADVRRLVGTGTVSPDAPVRMLATRPVRTIEATADVAAGVLAMVESSIHHLVVVDAAGRPVGVLRVVDLASAEVRDPLVVRAAVEQAGSLEDLRRATALLPGTAVALWDAGVPPQRIAGLLAAVTDAVVRRVLALDGGWDADTSWLVLGSLARREPLPTSDLDTAVVWTGGGADGEPGADGDGDGDRLRSRAGRVLDDLERVGQRRCPAGVNADDPMVSRSLATWRRTARAWTRDPAQEGALLLATMLVDSRPITNPGLGRQVGVELLGSARPPSFLRALLDYTLAARPPVGFVRDFVVEHSGEHRGEVDLKAGGLRPLTSLGRWAAVMTGTTGGSTPERLRRAVDAGLLTPDEGESLAGAQEHLFGLVMGLEVEALRADRTASTWVAPGRMDSLSRRHLREAFRAVARVQRSLESQWALRWDHG